MVNSPLQDLHMRTFALKDENGYVLRRFTYADLARMGRDAWAMDAAIGDKVLLHATFLERTD